MISLTVSVSLSQRKPKHTTHPHTHTHTHIHTNIQNPEVYGGSVLLCVAPHLSPHKLREKQ